MSDPLVMGVDGCPGGWLAILAPLGAPEAAAMRFAPHFADLFEHADPFASVAVDMPIGLPERLNGRGRACEVAVRKLLGPRQSSVFQIPARAAVMAADYQAACAAALAHSDPPRKVSKQAFFLLPKIRELDAFLRDGQGAKPARANLVHECHPEVAFWALGGGHHAMHPKKVKGRINPEGVAERRALLVSAGFSEALLSPAERLPGRAALDDLLDACVCCWSAMRIARGEATRFPETPERDPTGLPMAITV